MAISILNSLKSNVEVMVLGMRQLRRRGVGAVCKVLIIGVVIIALLQITTSAPDRRVNGENAVPNLVHSVHREQQHENRAQQVFPVFNNKQPSINIVESNHNHEDTARVPPSKHLQQEYLGKRESNVRENSVVRDSESKGGSRKGEFYENILVHFDLKGAPPKVPYFLSLLELVKKSGATGILLEWEDMFPYMGKLEIARNTDAYSMDEVKQILGKAKSLGLEIIPLVQTFAHLEWILKLEEFQKYRTTDEYPQVLCLSNKEGVQLIEDALSQVIAVHSEYGIPYFHIGCDEAFMYGVCKEDLEWMQKQTPPEYGNKEMLALTHMKYIAEFVKKKVGNGVTVLAWHDMLKNFPGSLIKKLDLSSSLEPVVWDYSEGIVTMNDWSFQALAENFPSVWASSAYKGANFPSAKYIDMRHYETNNRAWIDIVNANGRKFKNGFRGIIITGWQRYDHMAGLCEILPMGTPSMVLNVETALSASRKQDQKGIRTRAAHKMNCTGGEMYVQDLDLISTHCNFPGWNVYATFQRDVRRTINYVNEEMKKHHPTIGWLNPYNMKHNITQNWYLREITSFLQQQNQQLRSAEANLRQQMSELFYPNTVDEYVFETLGEHLAKVDHLLNEAQRLGQLRRWPKRHFPIQKTTN